jgi:alpha-beta hydrolase superfamily lysophospholipase
MSDRAHAVSFVNREGCRLFGILHEPLGGARRDVAILLLSPGIKNRVAPHRLYNKWSTQLAAQGFWVFRFDFYGLGDSEGMLNERWLADLYGSIQTGRYCNDTRDAMTWMTRTYGIPRFIVGGLCGGAITGLLAAEQDERVAGILALGIPVMLDGTNVDTSRFMTAGQATHLRSRYLKKALSPAAWLRLLSFRSDYRLLLRSFKSLVGGGRRRPAPPAGQLPPAPAAPAPAPGSAPAAGTAPAPPASNANPHFARAFLRVLERGVPVLLLFSEADRLYWEFEEKFWSVHGGRAATFGPLIDLQVVPGANHVLTFSEWQADMFARSLSWLASRFPTSTPLSPGPAATVLQAVGSGDRR